MEKKEDKISESEKLGKEYNMLVSKFRQKREAKKQKWFMDKSEELQNKKNAFNIGKDLDIEDELKKFEEQKEIERKQIEDGFEERKQKEKDTGEPDFGLQLEMNDHNIYWLYNKEEEKQKIIEDFEYNKEKDWKTEYYKWERNQINEFNKANEEEDNKEIILIEKKRAEWNIVLERIRKEFQEAKSEANIKKMLLEVDRKNKERNEKLEQLRQDKEKADRKAKEEDDKTIKKEANIKEIEEKTNMDAKEKINNKLQQIYNYYDYIFNKLHKHIIENGECILLIDLIKLYMPKDNIPNIYIKAYCKILSYIERCVDKLIYNHKNKINSDKATDKCIKIIEKEYTNGANIDFNISNNKLTIYIFTKDITNVILKIPDIISDNKIPEEIFGTSKKYVAEIKDKYVAPKMPEIRKRENHESMNLSMLLQIIFTYAKYEQADTIKIDMSNMFIDGIGETVKNARNPIVRRDVEGVLLHIQKIKVAPINLNFIDERDIYKIIHSDRIKDNEEYEPLEPMMISNMEYSNKNILKITFSDRIKFIEEYKKRILSDMHIDRKIDDTGLIYYYLPCDKKVKHSEKPEDKPYCTYELPHIFKIIWDPIYQKEYYRTTTQENDNKSKTTYYITKTNIDYNYEFAGMNGEYFIEHKDKYYSQIEENKQLIDYDKEKQEEANKQFYIFETPKNIEIGKLHGEIIKNKIIMKVSKGFPMSVLQDKDSWRFFNNKKKNQNINP
jgi:hypothetical protein